MDLDGFSLDLDVAVWAQMAIWYEHATQTVRRWYVDLGRSTRSPHGPLAVTPPLCNTCAFLVLRENSSLHGAQLRVVLDPRAQHFTVNGAPTIAQCARHPPPLRKGSRAFPVLPAASRTAS